MLHLARGKAVPKYSLTEPLAQLQTLSHILINGLDLSD